MLRFWVSIGFSLLIHTEFCSAFCPKNGISGSTAGSCFFGLELNKTFDDANNFCATYFNGKLASITTPLDDSKVLELARSFFKSAENVWLGGTYDGSKIEWLDGSPDVYQNFVSETAPGKVVLNLKGGQWSTPTWNSMIPFICLVKDNDISTPSPSPTVPSPNTCPNSSPCPSGWTYIETFKSCYKLIYTVNGASGDENCRVANANLASIHSPEENKIVYELTKTGVNDLQAWILFGGQRTGLGVDDWKWSDGSPWNYTNWAPGEPNNYSGNSYCVRFYADVTNPAMTAKWDDWPCDMAYRAALCQQPAKF